MRRTTTRSYLNYTGKLLRELRNSPDLPLKDRVSLLERLARTFKGLKELHQSTEAVNELAAQIKQIKKDLENKQNLPLQIVEPETEAAGNE